MSSKSRIVSTLRNTVLLSLLLGVTWYVQYRTESDSIETFNQSRITAAIQTDIVSLYISVILNASQGVYILIYSVLANTQVRGEVRERMSGVVSSYISSSQAKVSGGTLAQCHLGQTIKPHSNTHLHHRPLQLWMCFCLNNSSEIPYNILSWSSFSVPTGAQNEKITVLYCCFVARGLHCLADRLTG